MRQPFPSGSQSRQDATAVARLRAAGAIILGKTNTPEFLSNYETDNFITGRTNNPWNLERTPGGSSGGEAAAIASFCSAGGIGSDGGGSIRVPAHFCGIAGLKPTPGRIPANGHYPVISNPGGLLSVAGPLARSAEDFRLLFAALAGYDSQDPFSAPVPLRPLGEAGLRIGVFEQFYRVPVDPEIRHTVRRAAECWPIWRSPPSRLSRKVWSARRISGGSSSASCRRRLTKQIIQGRESDAHWTATEFLASALASRPLPRGAAAAEPGQARPHARLAAAADGTVPRAADAALRSDRVSTSLAALASG